MLEPGTVVAPGRLIPEGQLWGGNPATFVRELTEGEVEGLEPKAVDTWYTAEEHRQQFLPHPFAYVRPSPPPSPLFPLRSSRPPRWGSFMLGPPTESTIYRLSFLPS